MRYVRLAGSASRSEAALVALIFALAFIAGAVARSRDLPLVLTHVMMGLTALVMVALLATLVRRLHDMGRSGLWLLTGIVTPLIWIITRAIICWQPAGHVVQTKDQQGPARMIPRCGNDPVADGANCVTTQRTETLPDRASYHVLNRFDGAPGDDTPMVTLSDNPYLRLADHRDIDLDSRFCRDSGGPGLVSGKDLIAQVDLVALSTRGSSFAFFWTWRTDRFMLAPT